MGDTSPTCMANMPANSAGCLPKARMARRRMRPRLSRSSMRSAISWGRLPMRRCSAWYRARSPDSKAPARARACWKRRQRPSGDGVHGAGGIAHQRHVAAVDGFEAAGCGDAAALAMGRVLLRPAYAPQDLGKLRERIVQALARVAGQQNHADFPSRHRRDVKLAMVAPVDFHELAPGRHGVVAAETETAALPNAGIQVGPTPYWRLAAIGAHNPAR